MVMKKILLPLLGAVLCCAIGAVAPGCATKTASPEETAWKNDVVVPYLEALAETSRTVIFLSGEAENYGEMDDAICQLEALCEDARQMPESELTVVQGLALCEQAQAYFTYFLYEPFALDGVALDPDRLPYPGVMDGHYGLLAQANFDLSDPSVATNLCKLAYWSLASVYFTLETWHLKSEKDQPKLTHCFDEYAKLAYDALEEMDTIAHNPDIFFGPNITVEEKSSLYYRENYIQLYTCQIFYALTMSLLCDAPQDVIDLTSEKFSCYPSWFKGHLTAFQEELHISKSSDHTTPIPEEDFICFMKGATEHKVALLSAFRTLIRQYPPEGWCRISSKGMWM